MSSQIDRERAESRFCFTRNRELAASPTDRGLRRRKRSNPCATGRICSIGVLDRKVIMEIPVYFKVGAVVHQTAGNRSSSLKRILKAAPMMVVLMLLSTRCARSATCSFSPAPDPTVDGSPNSLRHAIQAANASDQDCLITLSAGTYTLTIKNTNGHGTRLQRETLIFLILDTR